MNCYHSCTYGTNKLKFISVYKIINPNHDTLWWEKIKRKKIHPHQVLVIGPCQKEGAGE